MVDIFYLVLQSFIKAFKRAIGDVGHKPFLSDSVVSSNPWADALHQSRAETWGLELTNESDRNTPASFYYLFAFYAL